MRTTHQRDREPDESGPFDRVEHEALGRHDAVDRHAPGQRAGDDHRDDDHAHGRNACVVGGGFAVAVGADLVAEPRPPDQQPEQQAGEERDEKAYVGGRGGRKRNSDEAEDIREERQFGTRSESTCRRIHRPFRFQDLDQQVHHEGRRDVVEHDRRDDDVTATLGLQPCGDEGPGGPEQGTANQRCRECQGPVRPGNRQADQRHAQAPEGGLSFAADVEEPGVERDRRAEPREDEIRRVEQRVAPAIARAERAGDHEPQRLERVQSEIEDHQPGNHERDQDRQQRDQDRIGPFRQDGHRLDSSSRPRAQRAAGLDRRANELMPAFFMRRSPRP